MRLPSARLWAAGTLDSSHLGVSGLERPVGRVLGFSDGVFTVAATVLVLEIQRPSDPHHLLRGLLELWPSYLAYALTFLLIGQVWANHHVMFDHVRASDWVLMLCNVLLMMVVAFLPFSASVLAEAFRDGDGQRAAVVFYGGSFALGSAFFNLIWRHARRADLFGDIIDERTEIAFTRRFGMAVPLYLVGTAVGAFLPVVGLTVFAAPAVFFWLPLGQRGVDREGGSYPPVGVRSAADVLDHPGASTAVGDLTRGDAGQSQSRPARSAVATGDGVVRPHRCDVVFSDLPVNDPDPVRVPEMASRRTGSSCRGATSLPGSDRDDRDDRDVIIGRRGPLGAATRAAR